MSDDSNRFAELMRRLRAGSREAGDELFNEYAQAVRRTVKAHMHPSLRPKFDSIDFEQQVWTSFFAKPNRMPDFKNGHQLVAYLAGMVHNKLVDENRGLTTKKRDIQREVRIDEQSKIAGPHPASSDPTPSAEAAFNEQWEILVQQQPEDVKRIVRLRLEGKTYTEIAEELGVSDRTVRQKMYDLARQFYSRGRR